MLLINQYIEIAILTKKMFILTTTHVRWQITKDCRTGFIVQTTYSHSHLQIRRKEYL
jgi:hypothetical protein